MGGILRHVRDLAIKHTAQGHDVGILCDVAGNEGYNEALLENLSGIISLGVKRVPMSRSIGVADLFAVSKTLRALKGLRPNIVHGHGAKGGLHARISGTLCGRGSKQPARLYSPHGGSLHFDPASRNGKLFFQVERALERMTDNINFVANHEAATYVEKIGEPTCSSRVIYNGLTDEEFEPVNAQEDAADFLFIGEMRMLKGPDLMLRALSRLKAEGATDVSAVLVGEGPDREEIHAMVRERDLQTNVTIRPPMPARAAFELARCVVMPSRAEAMPYIVLEALAAGKPLIATNVGGIPEIYGTDRDVLIEADVDPLTARMRQGFEELDALRKRMPNHETLRERFGLETMAANMLDAYHEALAKK